jgi:mannose-6-phosphate isomerase-like protein (cupin superfamily)
MLRTTKDGRIAACTLFLLIGVPLATRAQSAQEPAKEPVAKVFSIDPNSMGSAKLFGGGSETVTMGSGSVVLAPSQSVGKHTTEKYEEALIVLAGSGELRLADGTVLPLKPYTVAYCPPMTEHDVTNTGAVPLRYVYVVARARWE